MPTVASPPAVSRSTTTTLAPLLPKASAVARPMPLPAPVISATLPVKSRSMTSSLCLLADQPRPSCQIRHQFADQVARDLVEQIAVGVEFCLRLADQHLGLVQGVHVEKDAAAAQVALRAGTAGHAGGGTDDRHGLAGE